MGRLMSEDSAYQQAIQNAAVYKPTGFLKSEQAGSGREQLLSCISQHNLIIQLLLDLHSKVDSLEAEIKVLKREKGKAVQSDEIDSLVTQLKGLNLGPKSKVPESKGKFYAFKDPYVILEEAKKKK
uniref:ORF2 protein n=1 Tax=Cacao swollen shoot Ghana Q virus TaxID=2056885 RepID=A0A2H4U965_9VIRU|nr:ORF2 protein [Cacao swollen shoot Ghana Q virus]